MSPEEYEKEKSYYLNRMGLANIVVAALFLGFLTVKDPNEDIVIVAFAWAAYALGAVGVSVPYWIALSKLKKKYKNQSK